MGKTTLWNVYLTKDWVRGNPVVIVSDMDLSVDHVEVMRIRAISPNAAGRVYIKNNLARRLAIMDFETDNPASPTYKTLTDYMLQKQSNKVKNAVIKVVKNKVDKDMSSLRRKWRR